MIGMYFKAVTQLEAELHLLNVEILDVCIRPLFANPVTYCSCVLYVLLDCISYVYG